jgi:hypothetical protein
LFNGTALSNSVSDLTYATYLNTPHDYNSANKVLIDSYGNYYITVSSTQKILFTCGESPSEVYTTKSVTEDKTNVFVVKMDSDGHVHSSDIIGGESWDSPYGICIFNDTLYIAGETYSMKFLTTHGERNESSEGFLCSFSLDTLELKTS